MKIRRLRSAVLAVALGASVLAGTATQTSAAVATGGWPTPDWYKAGPFQTLAICDAYHDDAAQSGLYSGLVGCHWFGGGLYTPGYQSAGQCSGLQAGGEGPRGSAR
ncbi:hypothetical protein ABZ260_22350 [Streptosporangium sp. NPDC006013]|uniref:hypothetical protein n=1 Tax=Streptosporangium sp. NPDC006013 TaxID=3155596 RepID=UPI00339F06B2